MDLIFSNQTEQDIDEEFLSSWVEQIELGLNKQNILFPKSAQELVLVFLSVEEMRKMNLEFRGKDRPTDVLSFEGVEDSSLGELIFCLDVIQNNSVDHSLSFEEELGYMVIHGVLHLLGYDHEDDPLEAERMFKLQDQIFEDLSAQFFI